MKLNPFTDSNDALAAHELDVAYLLQNFNSKMQDKCYDHKLGNEMGAAFINFTYGEGIGAVGEGKEDSVLVLGYQGKEDMVGFWSKDKFEEGIMNGRGTLMEEIGWEKCFELGEILQGVSGDDPYRNIEKEKL